MASATKFWPRPRSFGLGLALISLSYYVIGHFSCTNRVKFQNFVIFFRAIILDWIGLSMVLRLRQHNTGYTADSFYRSDDPTNSNNLKSYIVNNYLGLY